MPHINNVIIIFGFLQNIYIVALKIFGRGALGTRNLFVEPYLSPLETFGILSVICYLCFPKAISRNFHHAPIFYFVCFYISFLSHIF